MFRIPRRSFVTVINQAEVAYREFLGMNRVRLEPGLRLNLPILHSIRRVDMRESMVTIPALKAFTKDNTPVLVSGSVFYKPRDAEKVCFSIVDLPGSLQAVTENSLRTVVGRFNYDEVTAKRNELSVEMLSILGKTTDDWGVECTRLEVQDFGPQTKEIAHHLEKQMMAERSRRENELDTTARVHTSKGERDSMILKSEGEATSTRNRAEASRFELEKQADALAGQVSAANFLLEMKRLEHLKEVAKAGNSVYFVSPDSVLPGAKVVTDLLKPTATNKN